MRVVAVLLMLVSCPAFASADLPFTNHYGRYEVVGCKKIDSTNNPTDWCSTKEILIQKAPTCKGAPHTVIHFASAGQIFNNTCTGTANIKYSTEESFSSGDQLSSEYYKYSQDEDGSDHYYIRVTKNNKFYVFTDFWLKKNTDHTVTAKFKRRETSIDDSNDVKSAFEYEITMKPTK